MLSEGCSHIPKTPSSDPEFSECRDALMDAFKSMGDGLLLIRRLLIHDVELTETSKGIKEVLDVFALGSLASHARTNELEMLVNCLELFAWLLSQDLGMIVRSAPAPSPAASPVKKGKGGSAISPSTITLNLNKVPLDEMGLDVLLACVNKLNCFLRSEEPGICKCQALAISANYSMGVTADPKFVESFEAAKLTWDGNAYVPLEEPPKIHRDYKYT
jgi:hypothetical protein